MSAVMRDPRAINAMDPDTKLIHAMLEAWGKWAKDMESHGWPAQTLLARMIEYGPQGASQQGRPPVAMPDEIAQIDAAVARLCQIDKNAVVAYYTRWEPPDVVAKRLRIKERELRRTLQRARWRLAAWLRI